MLKKLRQKGTIAGFKRTPQRLAILEHLDGNTSHPSADEIFRVVSKKNPSMSFATVYNTLNTLADAGAVRELTIDPDRKRYEIDSGAAIDAASHPGAGRRQEHHHQTAAGSDHQR